MSNASCAEKLTSGTQYGHTLEKVERAVADRVRKVVLCAWFGDDDLDASDTQLSPRTIERSEQSVAKTDAGLATRLSRARNTLDQRWSTT